MMSNVYTQSLNELNRIAGGHTSSVYRIPLEHQVVKVTDAEWESPERQRELYERELAAYQRMETRPNPPASILKFYGTDPIIKRGLLLELAERGDLFQYLHKAHDSEYEETAPEPMVLLKWAEQLAEALEFVHDCNIIHCDIHVANCFLDEDLNLKLADFGGCAIDGGKPMCMYRSTHQLWTYDEVDERWVRPYSTQSELFALGCTLYNMETGKDAFEGYYTPEDGDKDRLRGKLQRKEMPPLDELYVLGYFIDKCWKLGYSSMGDVLQDIRADPHGVML